MKFLRFFFIYVIAPLLPLLTWAQSIEPKNTVITSDGPGEMVSNEKQTETTITFKDNVVVTGTNMKLTCDYLEVVVIRSGDPKSASRSKSHRPFTSSRLHVPRNKT